MARWAVYGKGRQAGRLKGDSSVESSSPLRGDAGLFHIDFLDSALELFCFQASIRAERVCATPQSRLGYGRSGLG